MSTEIHDLFAVPVLHAAGVVPPALVGDLLATLTEAPELANQRSALLSHSAMLAPDQSPHLQPLVRCLLPPVIDFGAQLFGERLQWTIKEMWLNRLQTGGSQGVHNHANSFVSGVLYLTDSHASANTVFVRSVGGSDYSFRNQNQRAALGPYNAGKWVAPDPRPGDLLLFPSYLLHEVPVNQGGLRISLAFNAIPDQLDAWGYRVRFSA
jgi:uncharacterized protein (TIGR02466 family)